MTESTMAKTQRYLTIVALVVFFAIFMTVMDIALASTVAKSGTSFDQPLTILRGLFTGPIALTLSFLGIVVAGGMLVFGGELGQFTKTFLMVILAIALIATAGQLLEGLFGLGGATVAESISAGVFPSVDVVDVNLFVIVLCALFLSLFCYFVVSICLYIVLPKRFVFNERPLLFFSFLLFTGIALMSYFESFLL